MLSKLTPILNHVQSTLTDIHLPDLTSGELRTITILCGFWLLFALEARYTYRPVAARTSRQSYLTNLGSFILNDTVMSLLSVSSLWLIAERYADRGLLSAVSDPALKAIASFVLLDLVLYFWHRANHRFEALWFFHKIHHSDRTMNVSTAFRLHGVEVFFTAVIKAAFIVVMGVDAEVVLANEAIVTLFVMFHHANIGIPGERWLGWIAVVPRIHRTHHSIRRAEHDNNFAAVFSFWDRLFGTYAEMEPVEIGLPGIPGHDLIGLIRYGLPEHLSQPAVKAETLRSMIAEAAYYRAEKRGFAPGNDLIDWVEAEREILATTRSPRRHRRWPMNWHSLNPLTLIRGHGVGSFC